ncbi:MAG: transposase [Deltaproteobacteria bacterium]|nr:transposase [Deltaproteobacteria bacterium]
MSSNIVVDASNRSSRRSRRTTAIELEAEEKGTLEGIAALRTGEARKVERARILISLNDGESVSATAAARSIDRRTVRETVRRYVHLREEFPEAGVDGWLEDRSRTGRPDTFDVFLWTDILALVTTDPRDHGYKETHWSSALVARHLIGSRRVSAIHRTTISRFFAKADIKPHRVRQWLNRPDDPEFEVRAAKIKGLLAGASPPLSEADRKKEPGHFQAPAPDLAAVRRMRRTREERALVSFDEKTGMQAKERIAPDQPVAPGRIARQEFEYVRHGTMVLLALMVVQTGIVLARVLAHRANSDTARVLDHMLNKLWAMGYKGADIIVDQLNTHWSVDVVEVVARHCGIPMPSHDQIATGPQRREWLERSTRRRVVFHFCPKHSSWLNPIEIWFSVLVRKALRRGSFDSKQDLKKRVLEFVAYYNKHLAHPYRFKKYQLQIAA